MKATIEKLLIENERNSENIEAIEESLNEAVQHYCGDMGVVVEVLGSNVNLYGIDDAEVEANIYEYAYSIIRGEHSEVL